MTIQPTAVYSPGTSPAANPGGNAGQQGRVYVVQQPNPQPQGLPTRVANRVPSQDPVVATNLGNGLPYWLRGSTNNRAVVFNMWIIAMIIISFDEWHNLGVLPRPSRLWNTSLLYGILVLVGFVDVMVPLANILAIGYTFTLLWQYYQGNITPSTGSTQNA